MDELPGNILVAIMENFPPLIAGRKTGAGHPPKRGLEVNWPGVFVFLVLVLVGLLLVRRH